MEASSARKIGGRTPRDFFSSPRGTIVVAAGAAVLAGIVLFAFVQGYRSSVDSSASSSSVLVASGYIPRGTSTSLIASTRLMQRASVKSSQVVAGAISDPSLLRGEVAAKDIYPGQQLRAADFTASNVTIASQLAGKNRAIAIPIDAAHGLIGFVQAGDHVDILSSLAGTAPSHGADPILAQNVLVLSAPTAGGGGGVAGSGGSGGNIVLRVNASLAQELAYIGDNGKVWITLRPPVGALPASAESK
jgi:Flp pilus assembly protein CpaB